MSSLLIRHTTNKPLTTCSRSQAHSPTYLTCGGYITRNADIDRESTLKWAETKRNAANVKKKSIGIRVQDRNNVGVHRNRRHTIIILPHFKVFKQLQK
jgi:hypothetical protein